MSDRKPREPISGTKLFLIIWGPVPILALVAQCSMDQARTQALVDRANADYSARFGDHAQDQAAAGTLNEAGRKATATASKLP